MGDITQSDSTLMLNLCFELVGEAFVDVLCLYTEKKRGIPISHIFVALENKRHLLVRIFPFFGALYLSLVSTCLGKFLRLTTFFVRARPPDIFVCHRGCNDHKYLDVHEHPHSCVLRELRSLLVRSQYS